MLFVGCHLSATAGNAAMVKTAMSIDANTFAFFTRNPRGSKAKKEDPADAFKAVEMLKEHSFGPLVAHGAYTMNLCTQDPEARKFAAEVLADDLRRMAALPGNFYNFHPGSHVGQGTETGISQIADALKFAMSNDYPVTVLLETMAGKGSEVGGKFEELRMILDAVGRNNLGVCLDTCHVFDGGYDIVHNLDGVLDEFDRIVFESIVEKVIVGGFDEAGNPAPYKLTFVLKCSQNMNVADAKADYRANKKGKKVS